MANIAQDQAFWKRVLKEIARQARGDVDPEELLNIAFLRLERYSAEHTVKNPKAAGTGMNRRCRMKFLLRARALTG
jgi:hypothetical protein